LLDHYIDFINNDNNKLTIPPRILEETKEYLTENNVVKTFIDQELDITNNKRDCVSAGLLHQSFVLFYELLHTGEATPSLAAFKEKMIKNGMIQKKKASGKFWIGVDYKKHEDFLKQKKDD
jgi:hypothetical protein